MKMRKKSGVELFKDILLIFLVLACVFTGVMLKKYIFPSGTPTQTSIMSDAAGGGVDEEGLRGAAERLAEYMSSDFVVVNNGENRRLYSENSERYGELSDALDKILAEVFTGENETAAVLCGEEEWTAALSAGSVYIKLPCAVKWSETAAFPGVSVKKSFAGAEFDELAIMPSEESGVILYLRGSVSDEIQAYPFNLNADRLRGILNDYAGAGGRSCAYGFELAAAPERYSISTAAYEAVSYIDASAVIPLSEISVPSVTLGVPSVLSGSPENLIASSEIGGIVDMLGFDARTLRISCDRDDVKIFKSPYASLRIFPNGKIEFSSEQGLSCGAEESAPIGVAGMISKLCKALDINLSGGGASLKISGLERSGNEESIAFDYHIAGIPLRVSEEEHAVEARVKNGRLIEFKIYLKNFSASSAVPTERALSAIEKAAVGTPDIKINNIELQYKNISDGTPCECSWSVR